VSATVALTWSASVRTRSHRAAREFPHTGWSPSLGGMPGGHGKGPWPASRGPVSASRQSKTAARSSAELSSRLPAMALCSCRESAESRECRPGKPDRLRGPDVLQAREHISAVAPVAGGCAARRRQQAALRYPDRGRNGGLRALKMRARRRAREVEVSSDQLAR